VPRFHFHIRHAWTGILDADEEGLDFPDLAAAKTEALESARELVIERIRTNQHIDFQFEIADSRGELVCVVPFREAIGL